MTHPELIELLCQKRQETGESIREIAELIGCNKDTYNNFELGKTNLPSSLLLDLLHHYRLDMIIKPQRRTRKN